MWRDCALFIFWTKAHPCFYVTWIFGTWSCEPPKEALPAAVSCTQENSSYPEFLQQLVKNALLLCSLWCWKREEASIHLQSDFWGGLKDTWLPSELFACTKPQMFENTVMGLCWHAGWMKGLSATSIHSLNISLFLPLIPVKLQWE